MNLLRAAKHYTPSHASPTRGGWAAMLAPLLCACSTAGPSPATDPTYPSGAHELTCEYVGLEAIQGPPDVPDQDADSVAMLATYRFSEPDTLPPKPPLSLKFQVSRDRVSELRDQLSARPQVLCRPHGENSYAPDATTLPGMQGELQEAPP
jgi:hypothetical protein